MTSPDVSQIPHSQVGQVPGVQHDSAVFWCVNAVGFFLVFLLALVALVKAQRRRPWDAMFVAASPMVALTAFINWDMLARRLRGRRALGVVDPATDLGGVFIGLGAATKLYPMFFLGPLLVLCLRERRLDAWSKTAAAGAHAGWSWTCPIYLWSPTEFLWFWRFNASRGPDYGSIWLLFSMAGHSASRRTRST